MPRAATPDQPGMSIVHRGERLPSGQYVPSARASVDAQPVLPRRLVDAALTVGYRGVDAAHPRDLPLLGRHAEQLVLTELLDDLRAGMSRPLVLRGEPGMGKSALLEYTAESAHDAQVLWMVAVESETAWSFAAVHQLLLPLLSRIERLPKPQQRALRAAFGAEAGPPANQFLVGQAVLTLLSAVAEERPLLCLIDDAQWLDNESANVLGFAARRLMAEGVGIVFAVRETTDRARSLQALPELRLAGLDEQAGRELLAMTIHPPLNPSVAQQLVAETGGNPLALVEVASALTLEQAAGRAALPTPLPFGPRLEEPFIRRVRALPPDTRTLLLLAAADGSGQAERLWHGASTLGLPRSAAIPAETEALAIFWPDVCFSHPLVRSAVYHSATLPERRQAHRVLAIACDPDRAAEERAWHLAAAVCGPDEHVATALEASAERARPRGDYSSMAGKLERAALLTPDRSRRAGRQVRAAEAELLAGAVDRAAALLTEAIPDLDDAVSKSRAAWLDGRILLARGDAGEAAAALLRAAQDLQRFDPPAARDALFTAVHAAMSAGWSAHRGLVQEIARTVERIPRVARPEVTGPDLLLQAFAARVTQGCAATLPLLRHALDLMTNDAATNSDHLMSAISAAVELWDDAALELLTARWVQLTRETGGLTALRTALVSRIMFGDVPGGRLVAARAAMSETRQLEAEAATGMPSTAAQADLLPLVFAGSEAEARETVVAVARTARERGAFGEVLSAAYGLGVLEVSLCNYEAAAGWLEQVCEDDGPFATYALPDLVEAAVRAGRREVAEYALARLLERATVAGTPQGLGLLARSQALLAESDEAREKYDEAIEHLGRSRATVQLARTHLLYGEWLRRQRQRRAARDQLRTAQDMFEEMGLDRFAERSRVELQATGGHPRKRETDATEELTPQEAQIATLVSRGDANRDIAARLFISPSTVEYHLTKVFLKFGVTSRTQLARRVLDRQGTVAQPV